MEFLKKLIKWKKKWKMRKVEEVHPCKKFIKRSNKKKGHL